MGLPLPSVDSTPPRKGDVWEWARMATVAPEPLTTLLMGRWHHRRLIGRLRLERGCGPPPLAATTAKPMASATTVLLAGEERLRRA